MRKIILLSSRLPQMGKDTVGSHLINKYGYTRVAYADKVKEVARDAFGWDGKKDERGRRLLINVGTITGREYNPNIWVDYVIKKIIDEDIKNVVITDCRFESEFFRIKDCKEFKDDLVYSIGIDSTKFGDKNYEKDVSQIEFNQIPKHFLVMNEDSKDVLFGKIDSIMTYHIGTV